MATIYPTSKEELARINGVGMGKVNKFGDVFMEAIQKYVKENDITTANDVVVKSAINKSKLKIYIIQAIDRKIDLDEISETKNTTPEEVLKEIENIIYSGTKLNLDYYINQVLDPERQEDLMEYFLNAETDDLQVAMDDDANQDYSEEEIRLMRIKFLSEYAN
jgi:ATP-dependent DNA helicase RecQ